MATSHPVDLRGVQKTLLLPLWGRAVESRKARPLLTDPAAIAMVDSIGYDFSTIAAKMSRVTQLAWVVRCLHCDRIIRALLERHPAATIVNLGCGLDTTLERVDNGRLRWFDLDLPEVMELRAQLLPPNPRRNSIARSLLDERWMGEIGRPEALLVISLGVLYYLKQDELRGLFSRLANRFPASEACFDVCSAFGLRVANKRVIEDGGMDSSAALTWSIEDPRELEGWDPRFSVLDAYPLFRGAKGGLCWKEKWGTFLSDRLRVMSMVHLRLGEPAAA